MGFCRQLFGVQVCAISITCYLTRTDPRLAIAALKAAPEFGLHLPHRQAGRSTPPPPPRANAVADAGL
ncbi:hypothetical protein EKH55_1689 [Sinorhizobium alkalisoli]|nr:hypothetical protein EKH55_1689 [Sinorhizobium alkalisoli]